VSEDSIYNITIPARDHFKSFMKKVLDLARARNNEDDFKAFKAVTVDLAYGELDRLFQRYLEQNVVKACSCKNGISNRKNGYYDPDCICNGTGYVGVKES